VSFRVDIKRCRSRYFLCSRDWANH